MGHFMQEYLDACQPADHVPDVVKALLLPSVQLTAEGGELLYMTAVDISHLPTSEFAKLYTVSYCFPCAYPMLILSAQL